MAEETRSAARVGADVRRTIVGIVAGVVRWAGAIFALLLAAHVVLTVGGANPSNGITRFVANWADPLTLGFRDLFTPDDLKLRVLVNYGLAALFWLIISAVIARLVRRLG
ncbi:hypothetical protein [Gandjariella thermophila]|uniref:YggT family protein n=1 Tax=Gandjariella thermophila TaxID=1931992 RepID=A0A4D4J2I9_9PSEU|nr:hypothetical protein [Gandjariella thermophila]GDY30691.1 hypothetical protein GTS_23240 [Gandjariella thermophila]